MTTTIHDHDKPMPQSNLNPSSATHSSSFPSTFSPSFRLLYSHLPRRYVFLVLTPAVISSIVTGAVSPFMTLVVGKVFEAFAEFPQSDPTSHDSANLIRSVGIASLALVGLACGTILMNSLSSYLWILTGEHNVLALRRHVYHAITRKDMVWFDLQTGAEGEGDDSFGVGGLTAKFSRETDDVRMATSLAAGQLLQFLTTCIACLAIAFVHSWSLTLVVLSAVPFLILIQAISQTIAAPLLASDRSASAAVATLIERAITSISTLKAFNAEPYQVSSVSRSLDALSRSDFRLNILWSATSALAQFATMAMFVQGFWFGSSLIREGKISAADIMTVFWACLIFTTSLQLCVPQIIALSKGKFSLASLLTLAGNHPSPTYSNVVDNFITGKEGGGVRKDHLETSEKKHTCIGEFSLQRVSFTYPTRETPSLRNVSLYLPGQEMTFIVGTSGSGKSTIAQLLLRLYPLSSGEICLDEYPLRSFPESWLRSNVLGVGQGWGDVVVEGKSFAENVMFGVQDVTVTTAEEACRVALLHDFVRELPYGYDTILGGTGVTLSGGQRQKLAIARAWLRNPPVLVLDEVTSALDATSRLLVFEAIRVWRRNKTTVVITHDLSQISADDFVYVVKEGEVVEQGFRCDLERDSGSSNTVEERRGEFRNMMDVQLGMGGCLPPKALETAAVPEIIDIEPPHDSSLHRGAKWSKHQTLLRPITLNNWRFDAIADLTSPFTPSIESPSTRVLPMSETGTWPRKRRARPLTLHNSRTPTATSIQDLPRLSLQFSPKSPAFAQLPEMLGIVPRSDEVQDAYEEQFEKEKSLMESSGRRAVARRAVRTVRRPVTSFDIEVVKPNPAPSDYRSQDQGQCPTFWDTVRSAYPTIPYKSVLFIGLLISLLSGAMTPLFAILISRLLFEASTGGHDVALINRFGGITLGVAALDGLLLGLKHLIMEMAGMNWITALRRKIFGLILDQDKTWFDQTVHGTLHLVHVLIKDGDDARDLVAVVFGQCFVVASMLTVGLVWALFRGWQLTLVGLGIVPFFVVLMGVQTRLISGFEARNRKAREDVAKGFYNAIGNVRGIRSMGFEHVFQEQFDKVAKVSFIGGVRGAYAEGSTYGVASGLIYFSEALLFYVGAVLVAKGTYTYLQMVEVLNLVVFSVTIGSQLMAFTQRIAKTTQCTGELNMLLKEAGNTPSDSSGTLRPHISGSIVFKRVEFAYPERPEVPVLKGLNLTIRSGETVAIVGRSGAGKSTIAALLQRLYEPSSGKISVNGVRLSRVNVHHLREHISIVSQHPDFFDASISENIRYGSNSISDSSLFHAARLANVHDFVEGLTKGYDTLIGDNATRLSAGQAQRLQIARALARPADVLVFDECTSALDPENQRTVLEAIARVVKGEDGDGEPRQRTTVMVTHQLQVMRMCNRIVVLDEGKVAEEGTFEELRKRKGVFATLASGGEWVGG